MERQAALLALHLQAQNFTRLALRDDLEGPTADFAVGRETLISRARVNDDLERLPAKGTLHPLADFHDANLRPANPIVKPSRARTVQPRLNIPLPGR
jgi:hypothetical protein